MFIVAVEAYADDVWWPELTCPTRRGLSTSQSTILCNLIVEVIYLELRAVLLVWRTTTNAVLHREGTIPPARVLLECSRLRFSARLNSLDDRHPLRSRTSTFPNSDTFKYKKKSNNIEKS